MLQYSFFVIIVAFSSRFIVSPGESKQIQLSKKQLSNCEYVASSHSISLVDVNDKHRIGTKEVGSLDLCKQACCESQLCDSFIFINTICQLLDCSGGDLKCQFDASKPNNRTFYREAKYEEQEKSGGKSTPAPKVAPVKSCTEKQLAQCGEHEVCVVSLESSEGYACNCLSGFFRNSNGLCLGAATKTPVESDSGSAPVPVDVAKDASSPLVVSLGGNKQLNFPVNETKIQSTIIPAPSDDDKVPYEYRWSVLSKPKADVSTLDHMGGTATLKSLSSGLYTIKLEVTHGNQKGADEVDIEVKKPPRINKPPVALVKPNPAKVTLPNSEAILNAADSTDDSGIVSYVWTEVKRPSTAEALEIDNSDASSPILKLKGLVPGQYIVSLTVTDEDGVKNSTNVNITVNPAIDYPPTANAGSDQVITLPTNSITLYGNTSTDDKQIVAYKWQTSPESASLPADMTGTKSSELHLSNLEAGTYTFILEVEDSIGQKDQAQVHVIVEEPRDKPPKAVITPEGSREVYLPDSTVALDASKSSDDNGIEQFLWSIASQPTDSAAMIEKADQAVTKLLHLTVEGVYVVKVEVTDASNQKSAAELTVTVHPDTNLPPVANAGPDLRVDWPVEILSVSGLASSDDGEIVKWNWQRVEEVNMPAAGREVNRSRSQPVLLLSRLVPGKYAYKLTVSDVQGVQSSDVVEIAVSPPSYLSNLLEMRLFVPYLSLTSTSFDTILRNIAVDLSVEDEEVVVVDTGENRHDGTVFILFYVVENQVTTVKRGLDVRDLLKKKLNVEPKRYTYDVTMIDTYKCQNNCSNHGKCNSFTKECECDGFWMENMIGRLLFGLESNCDWSVLYFVIIATLVLAFVTFSFYLVISYTTLFDRVFLSPCCATHSAEQMNSKNAKLPNGSISSSKKLRKRRKRLNNNEYVELTQTAKTYPQVEIQLSSGGDSSDELFTAKPSLTNGIPKMNGSILPKEL